MQPPRPDIKPKAQARHVRIGSLDEVGSKKLTLAPSRAGTTAISPTGWIDKVNGWSSVKRTHDLFRVLSHR